MAIDAMPTRDGLRLRFRVGRIEYDADRDVSMVYPKDNFFLLGHIEVNGKISPEKCREMFGESVDGVTFGKGYEDNDES